MSSRARNTAELMDYVKALRANIDTWHNGFVSLNLDEVAGAYQDFLVDLLSKTVRPTKDLLLKAAKSTYKEVAEPELAMFVDRMMQVVQYCRTKSKSMSTGAKMHPSVCKLAQLLPRDRCLPSPSPPKATSSTSSSSVSTRAGIFSLYGLEDDKKKRQEVPSMPVLVDDEVIEVCSEEEPEKPAAEKPAAEKPGS